MTGFGYNLPSEVALKHHRYTSSPQTETNRQKITSTCESTNGRTAYPASADMASLRRPFSKGFESRLTTTKRASGTQPL